jgi:hypothetical protein
VKLQRETPEAFKRERMTAYDIAAPLSDYELDHLTDRSGPEGVRRVLAPIASQRLATVLAPPSSSGIRSHSPGCSPDRR